MLDEKDFKAVAEIIKNNYQVGTVQAKGCLQDTAERLADYFATQNPHFDRNRFMRACGLE